MKLVSFSVRDFRSIRKAERLSLGKMTVLIGPNNEGKSNILRAMSIALKVLSRVGPSVGISRGRIISRAGRYRRTVQLETDYDWVRDFPISLQNEKESGESVMDLEFDLSDEESQSFYGEVQSSLNGTLPIRLRFGQRGIGFQVRKQGKGGRALSQKATPIAKFIAKRLDFQSVSAIRPAAATLDIVEDLVSRELAVVEESDAYSKALNKLTELQEPVFLALSSRIQTTLQGFMEDVKKVEIKLSRDDFSQALRRSCRVILDDGTATDLQQKGDGIQSLAAISLIRHVSETSALGRQLMLAIEEPESHLHPRAIHHLRAVLNETAEKHQVIITTHSPLLINRADLRSNIIVRANRARSAKTVAEIRDCLGVRTADNLVSAELVLVLEGEHDRQAFISLLADSSAKLAEAIHEGLLGFDSLGGGSNLAYKLTQLRDCICYTHVFLDDDDAGIRAATKAETEGLLSDKDLTYSKCPGMPEAEIEDLYDVSLYAAAIKNAYDVDVTSPKFRANKPKWSDRLKELFRSAGKQWGDRKEAEIKRRVADLVVQNRTQALNSHKRSCFDALVRALEDKLAAIHRGGSSSVRD